MDSPQPADRSPRFNGLAVLQRQGYGIFAAKICLKSHWAMKRAEAQKAQSTVARKAAAKKTTGRRSRGKAQKTAEAPLTVAAQ